VHLLTHETPDFITPALWPANSPDLNPVDYQIWGSCTSVCTAARFVTSTSLSRARSKSGNISNRWSSIKQSGSGIHVFDLAFDFEHTVDILNTDIRCAGVLSFARTRTWQSITPVPIVRVGQIMPFFRQIAGKRAFSMAKLSTEYESENKNVLRWCFRSVNSKKKSKWRPKMWNFRHRPPLNDPFVHLMFNFFCFQHRRVPIYLCIRCRGYYFFALCSLIASDVYLCIFCLFSTVWSIFIVRQEIDLGHSGRKDLLQPFI